MAEAENADSRCADVVRSRKDAVNEMALFVRLFRDRFEFMRQNIAYPVSTILTSNFVKSR